MVRRNYDRHEPIFVGIEDFGHGLGIIQAGIRQGLPIRNLRPDKEKVARAIVAQPLYERHRLYHPRGPGFEWVKKEWEPELITFPNAAHDDQVDTLAYAARALPNITVGRTRRRERRPGEMAGVRTREM
jgi:predicted phage terminase large subunit-like protein